MQTKNEGTETSHVRGNLPLYEQSPIAVDLFHVPLTNMLVVMTYLSAPDGKILSPHPPFSFDPAAHLPVPLPLVPLHGRGLRVTAHVGFCGRLQKEEHKSANMVLLHFCDAWLGLFLPG